MQVMEAEQAKTVDEKKKKQEETKDQFIDAVVTIMQNPEMRNVVILLLQTLKNPNTRN
jgi:hypothetical protein